MHSSHGSNRNQETGANCSNVFGSQHKYGSSSQATMKPQCNTCQKFHFGGCRYKGKSRCGRCNLFGHNTNDCNDYKQLANCAQEEEEVSIANLFYVCHVASIKDKVSPAEIEKEKHTEVAVTDLVAGENQNKKTIDATEVVHDEFKNEELAKQDKQQFKEGKEDTENCKPINLGEETTKESHQIYDLKAEKSHEDKMENEIQNEEISNESREYLHQSAVENETINGSFPDEALVKNAEDMGTKLQVENHSDETTSGNDGRTETSNAKEEEFLSQIQNLQKELSFLSSCSLAKEKENLIKDLEKTKVKLKETESKLKNVVQEKTKLEGQKAFAEREVKRLHGQKTLLERDISKRDSLAGRRRDSMVDRSSKMFDSKKSKGLAASFEQIMQEDYRNLEVLAFKMEATIASLEEEVTAAHKKKEETKEHVKKVEIEVDEHLSATRTTENTCSQKEATLLLCDNMSAISMARNPD